MLSLAHEPKAAPESGLKGGGAWFATALEGSVIQHDIVDGFGEGGGGMKPT